MTPVLWFMIGVVVMLFVSVAATFALWCRSDDNSEIIGFACLTLAIILANVIIGLAGELAKIS